MFAGACMQRARGKFGIDPYYANVALLLHGDGTDGSTTIVDNSPLPKTVSVFGNARIATAQSKFGGSSLYFDGSGDYMTIPSGAGVIIGRGDFTIEAWVRWDSISAYRRLVSTTNGAFTSTSFCLRLNNSNNIGVFFGNTGYTSSSTVTTGTWYHLAVVRKAGAVTLYINGVSAMTATDSMNISDPIQYIGGYYTVGPAEYHNGYIDDLRITVGVARYTAAFTPPAQAYPNA